MNSYLVFFVISYCSIFAFYMNFDDISYLTKYSSLYESSSTGNYQLLCENPVSSQVYNASFSSAVAPPIVSNKNKQCNESIVSDDYNNFLVIWENYKWIFLYYLSLFLIPASLTVLYLSPDLAKGLDVTSFLIYLGLISFAFIANNDTLWLLDWAKTISQNSVSLNTKVNTTISSLYTDNINFMNELNTTSFMFNDTLHSKINSTFMDLNSKLDLKVTVLNDNIVGVNTTLDSRINAVTTALNNNIIDIGNKMVLKIVHETIIEDLKRDYNSKIDDLTNKVSSMESQFEKKIKNILEKYETKFTALENEFETKLNRMETRAKEAFVEQDKKISVVNEALVSINSVSQSFGSVTLWSLENLPHGWIRCDGTGGVPNLLDRFVVSAGGQYKLMQSGGNDSLRLTEGQMFPHTHGKGEYKRLLSVATGQQTFERGDDSPGEPGLVSSGELQKVGNGDPIDIRPKYVALYFICKKRTA
jgi:hypothetical protein